MKIIIFGATGGTGKEIVKQALEQGHEVTAFVRNPAKLDIQHDHLKIATGDVTDEAAVTGSINEHQAALSALGATTIMRRMPELVDGVRNILAAMKKCGTQRFVYESALGVGDSAKEAGFLFENIVRPFILKNPFADHEEKENLIKASSVEWIIVRPSVLTNGERTGNYRTGIHLKSDSVYSSVSRADVADFMLKQLSDNQYLQQTPNIFY